MAFVLVNLSRRNSASNNLAEKTITHESMLTERFVAEQ